jgi:UTP--glucose-1-phosphate uridylyltransferase
VNGGLGTSMGWRSVFTHFTRSHFASGLTGAKSSLEVQGGMTFLDLIVKQVQHLNATRQADIPLVLMTSFHTHEDTLTNVRKYANQGPRITLFAQSRFPKIFNETLLPVAASFNDSASMYPPGHGDLYMSLVQSGVLDRLVSEGKEYLFVSNSDNLGATYVRERPLLPVSLSS